MASSARSARADTRAAAAVYTLARKLSFVVKAVEHRRGVGRAQLGQHWPCEVAQSRCALSHASWKRVSQPAGCWDSSTSVSRSPQSGWLVQLRLASRGTHPSHSLASHPGQKFEIANVRRPSRSEPYQHFSASSHAPAAPTPPPARKTHRIKVEVPIRA